MSAETKPLWVLLPVKGFDRAKSRLSPILGGVARAGLAQQMCEHVLATLSQCAAIDGVLVLSDSDEVLELAQRHGCHGERELGLAGEGPLLGAIVDDGLLRLSTRGARSALVLMSDLPLLAAADLQALVSLLADHDCVIAPDLRETNTNALGLRLDGARRAATAFGSGDSFRLHVEIAAASGLRTAVHRSRGLGFDVDLPADYCGLPDRVGAEPGRRS